MKTTAVLLISAALCSGIVFGQIPVWIGVGLAVEEGRGVRVVSLPYGSPAARAGVLINDIIVGADGAEFPPEATDFDQRFRDWISRQSAGNQIALRLNRGAEAMTIQVQVEQRPVGIGGGRRFGSLDSIERKFPKIGWPEEQLAGVIIDEFQIRTQFDDLRQRLAALSYRADYFRLSRLAYIQHDPFQLRTVAGATLDGLAAMDPLSALDIAVEWLDGLTFAAPPLRRGLTLNQHLDQLTDLLNEARAKREEAFARLTADDRKYFEEHSDTLFTVFAEGINLQEDEDMERLQRNVRLLELAALVNFPKLFEGAALLWASAQDEYLRDLESSARRAWESAGMPDGIFINRESPVGRILVAGNGGTWHSEDAAILIDLAGNDFYTNNAGSPRGDKVPGSLLIDFAGDDAYEATLNWTQAAARMGFGIFIDRKGNDQYVSRAWTQGAAVLGAALFLDEAGNDVYRADEYAQGIAAWGIALHMDYGGDDIYEAHLLSQGVAMPGGAGWLLNGRGNDRYYSKGKRPTVYGDVGIFDSWSQGSAIGFRGLQSGGIGVLYDGAGVDRYEAGNFSQGGGYYFGVGLFRDGGRENDVHIGSHYNQGFAAHQAAGYFEEAGGNDFYATRHAVAQGTSWDEAIVAFIDHGGDDIYQGGASFSQGASAHNAFCMFLDLGGRNSFAYSTPQGFAGPNDYHGGTSFSLFVAADDRGNTYTSNMKRSSIELHGNHGVFVDLPASIENALRTKSLQSLIRR